MDDKNGTGKHEAALPLLPMPAEARRLDAPWRPSGNGLRLTLPPELEWLGEEIREACRRRYGPIEIGMEWHEDGSWDIALENVSEGESDKGGDGRGESSRGGDGRGESSREESSKGGVSREADGEGPAGGHDDLPQEGYRLSVGPSGILIRASDRRGALYGWATLSQWLWAHLLEELPGLEVRDAPALGMRGLHVDLKGAVPNIEYLLRLVERLASYKINTLMVEYENQIPLASLPGIHKPGGLERHDIARLAEAAERWGIEIMPVVQSLGHADYILRDPRYEELGEDGLLSQFCPCHPGTMELVKAMIGEIAAMHPDSAYMHIGADETHALGRCPRCREAAQTGSKADLYLRYVGEVASYVLSLGMKPVVWDDMFHLERCIERVAELPRGTVICSWSYYEYGEPSTWFWYGGGYYSSAAWRELNPGAVPLGPELESLPEAELELLRECWDEGGYPLEGRSAVPWVRRYMELGYEVIGASCARAADFTNGWSPYPRDRMRNVSHWARQASAGGMTGVIASAWTRFYSLSPPVEHWETGWQATLAHAAASWNPRDDGFDAAFRAVFLQGREDIAQAMAWMEQAWDTREEGNLGHKKSYLLAAAAKLAAVAGADAELERYVEGLRLSTEYEIALLDLENSLRQNEWRLYGAPISRLTERDYIAERDRRGLARCLGQAQAWERQALEYCGGFMPAEEAQELVLSKLHPYKERIALLDRRLGWEPVAVSLS